MFYVITLILTGFVVLAMLPVTALAWMRCDDLADRYAETRYPGLLRTLGSTVGWWLLYTALLVYLIGGGALAAMPLLAGLYLLAASVVARRNQTLPGWYRKAHA